MDYYVLPKSEDEFGDVDKAATEAFFRRKLGPQPRGELFETIYAALLEALEGVEVDVVREAAGKACECVGAIV